MMWKEIYANIVSKLVLIYKDPVWKHKEALIVPVNKVIINKKNDINNSKYSALFKELFVYKTD